MSNFTVVNDFSNIGKGAREFEVERTTIGNRVHVTVTKKRSVYDWQCSSMLLEMEDIRNLRDHLNDMLEGRA